VEVVLTCDKFRDVMQTIPHVEAEAKEEKKNLLENAPCLSAFFFFLFFFSFAHAHEGYLVARIKTYKTTRGDPSFHAAGIAASPISVSFCFVLSRNSFTAAPTFSFSSFFFSVRIALFLCGIVSISFYFFELIS
jgi:hypothetical protein